MVLPKVLTFQYYISSRWVRTNLSQQFCHMKTDFYKIYKTGCSGKYPNYENSMLHHCCEHCQVKSIVLQTCLQTISSSVLSSNVHLKPACVCKFSLLGSLHVIMKIVITTLIRLQVCASCWYESYLRAFE